MELAIKTQKIGNQIHQQYEKYRIPQNKLTMKKSPLDFSYYLDSFIHTYLSLRPLASSQNQILHSVLVVLGLPHTGILVQKSASFYCDFFLSAKWMHTVSKHTCNKNSI